VTDEREIELIVDLACSMQASVQGMACKRKAKPEQHTEEASKGRIANRLGTDRRRWYLGQASDLDGLCERAQRLQVQDATRIDAPRADVVGSALKHT
jgi:hypothetical protein